MSMLMRTLWAPREVLRRDGPTLLWLATLTGLAVWLETRAEFTPSLVTVGSVGVVAAAVTIFLSFRVSEAYGRWWEARILWGGLVNDSRTFARQVVTLLTPQRVTSLPDAGLAIEVQRELVHRHIGYIYALGISLRQGGRFSPEDLEKLSTFLPRGEIGYVRRAVNIPTRLVQRQGARLAEICGASFEEQQVLLAMDATLGRLYDLQGGCERIKNTVFPASVTHATRVFVWVLASILPFALVDTPGSLTRIDAVLAFLMALMFVKMEQLGGHLKNPFAGQPDDTPVTALGRTIERDLRQMLGERDIPPPALPLRGVLM